MDPYEIAAEYETEKFRLRLVRPEDAQDLLMCYGDPIATARMNTDGCVNDFYCSTQEKAGKMISFWLEEYERRAFIRLAIVTKKDKKAIGTIELFGREWGVLRLDLADAYDTPENIRELLGVCIREIAYDLDIPRLYIKAINIPERLESLTQYAFAPEESFRPGRGYWGRPEAPECNTEKGIAYCGLACCVCSENAQCMGCRKNGCAHWEACKAFACCRERKYEGCWNCPDFPCDNPLLKKPRVRAFVRFIKRYGEDMLMHVLMRNARKGILYHYPKRLTGDYDLLKGEEEILSFLKRALKAEDGENEASCQSAAAVNGVERGR